MAQEKIVFVLWADRFDETAAALFVAELRRSGVRVKLVSLVSHPSPGAYGVSLVPDLTLEQALPLARYASAVIIPCGASGLSRLQNDPRLQEFLVNTSQTDSILMISEAGSAELEALTKASGASQPVVVFADEEDAMAVVCRIEELKVGMSISRAKAVT